MPGVFVGGPGGPGSIEKKTGGLIEAWYSAFNSQNYDALLPLFPDELYQKVSRDQMMAIFVSYRSKLGGNKSRKVNFAKENHTAGESTYVMQYASVYESGASHDTFTIVSKGPSEPPRIAKVEFDSPALKR